jgi:protein-disulfide isomerase
MGRSFWVVVAVVVAIFVGVNIKSNSGKTSVSATTDKYVNKNILEVKPSDNVKGAGTKKVELVEYGDFQCPACKGYFPLVKQLESEFGDQIKVVYRHLPIDSAHPKARAAHRASVAAANQGKFWEMHDKLYETQDTWKNSGDVTKDFEAFATGLGISDMEKFKTDVASELTNSIINTDSTSAKEVGAKSTPTFFLNGKLITNPADYASFKKLIEDEITAKNPGAATTDPATSLSTPSTDPSAAPEVNPDAPLQ